MLPGKRMLKRQGASLMIRSEYYVLNVRTVQDKSGRQGLVGQGQVHGKIFDNKPQNNRCNTFSRFVGSPLEVAHIKHMAFGIKSTINAPKRFIL